MGESLYISIIAIACFGYIFAEKDLPNNIKDFIFEPVKKYWLFSYIFYALCCTLCVSFWFCLLYTGSFYASFICAVLSEAIAKYLSYVKE